MQRFGDLSQHASTLIRMQHGQLPAPTFFTGPLQAFPPQYPHSFPSMSIAERLAGKNFTFTSWL